MSVIRLTMSCEKNAAAPLSIFRQHDSHVPARAGVFCADTVCSIGSCTFFDSSSVDMCRSDLMMKILDVLLNTPQKKNKNIVIHSPRSREHISKPVPLVCFFAPISRSELGFGDAGRLAVLVLSFSIHTILALRILAHFAATYFRFFNV